MPKPDPKIIRDMTRKMVLDAGKNGTLSKLTPRTVREKLQNDLGLEDHALKPFKDVIKDSITKALDNENVDEDEQEQEQEKQKNVEVDVEVKKPTAKEKKKKAEGKPPVKKSSNKPLRSEFSSPEAPTKGKKRKSETADGAGSSKTKKPRVSSDAKTKGKKAFASAAVVPPSSDFEDNIPAKPTKDNLFSADEATPKKPLSPDDLKVVASSNKSLAIEPEEQPDKSESELSVLIDEPPKRKKGKAKEPSEANENKERKRRGAASAALSKDEETIKRLKSLINACGIRKVWSKVFKNIEDSPSKQIALLRKMLADLGMTGRLSMEQAKSIKEKRELASELADVQSFEQTIKNQSSRPSRSAATKEESAEAESEKASDEEDNVRPAKRKSNARQSIMAFLENQSDSE
ncbi:hypothetical protein EV368DRAFT_65201 [Lentinula lateritia]|nr:hypothetical protein EV368DRAFT_65201 [Lentinula lateritia]